MRLCGRSLLKLSTAHLVFAWSHCGFAEMRFSSVELLHHTTLQHSKPIVDKVVCRLKWHAVSCWKYLKVRLFVSISRTAQGPRKKLHSASSSQSPRHVPRAVQTTDDSISRYRLEHQFSRQPPSSDLSFSVSIHSPQSDRNTQRDLSAEYHFGIHQIQQSSQHGDYACNR